MAMSVKAFHENRIMTDEMFTTFYKSRVTAAKNMKLSVAEIQLNSVV